MKYVILNGILTEESSAHIPRQDRGFRYGDGVFETILVAGSTPYQWSFHMWRLSEGLKAIFIDFQVESLNQLCQQLLAANNAENCLLRIQVTRGIGSRGYLPSQGISPTLLIETMETPPLPRTPVSLGISTYTKISTKSLPVNFKLCQGLSSTLVRLEAERHGWFDGILLNGAGEICETSSANIFWLQDDTLYTPALSCGALAGSIRNAVIKLSPYKVLEVAATSEAMKTAEEIFITNTAYKILPVASIEGIFSSKENHKAAKEILALLHQDIENKTHENIP